MKAESCGGYRCWKVSSLIFLAVKLLRRSGGGSEGKIAVLGVNYNLSCPVSTCKPQPEDEE